jgi:hypothetical protein
LAALGFLIGVETELPGQAAEEGTHALAALGAAAFALISARALPGSDRARVAAGLVTGSGLLGVGMIVKREGERIEGLATTAGMWAVGPIGVAMEAGMYLLGTVTGSAGRAYSGCRGGAEAGPEAEGQVVRGGGKGAGRRTRGLRSGLAAGVPSTGNGGDMVGRSLSVVRATAAVRQT